MEGGKKNVYYVGTAISFFDKLISLVFYYYFRVIGIFSVILNYNFL